MRTKSTLILISTTLGITTALLVWQLWSSHQLQQQISSLQQQLSQQNNQLTSPLTAAGPGSSTITPPVQHAMPPATGRMAPPASAPLQAGPADPFADFDRLQQQMLARMQNLMGSNPTSLFDTNDPLFGAYGAGNFGGPDTDFASPLAAEPEIVVANQPEAFVVTITLPEGSDIELNTSVENTKLNIEGKLTVEQKGQANGANFSSTQTQQFARTITLPHNIDPLGIANETRGNQVIITLPKTG